MSTFLTRSPVSCSRKVSPIAGLLRILSRVTELLIARVMDKLQEHRLEIVTGSVPLWLQFVFIMILKYSCTHIQGVPKKMSFLGKMAIYTFKLIQSANVGGVLENSGNLLHYGHRDFKN